MHFLPSLFVGLICSFHNFLNYFSINHPKAQGFDILSKLFILWISCELFVQKTLCYNGGWTAGGKKY